MDKSDFEFEEYSVAMGVYVGNGQYYFKCCERLWPLQDFQGLVYGVCGVCGKEYVLGEEFGKGGQA